jgi:hypothetical protein
MRIKHILIILTAFILLGVLALFLTPQKLSPEEEIKADENRLEIIRSMKDRIDTTNGPIDTTKIDTVSRSQMPAPTDVLSEESDKRAFEEYIDIIHKAAPGVNWRAINEQNSEAQYDKYIYEAASRSHTDTLANGQLVGSWHEKGSVNNAGRTLFTEPDTISGNIYIASGSGNVWRGNKNGGNWQCLNNLKKFGSLSLLRLVNRSSAPHRIVAVTEGNSAWYSDNEGIVWNKATGLENIESWGGIEQSVMCNDSLHTIYVLAHDWDYQGWFARTAVYKSIDHGSTYKLDTSFNDKMFGGPESFSLWTPYYGSGKLYMLADSVLMTRSITDTIFSAVGIIGRASRGRGYLAGIEYQGKTILYAQIEKRVFKSSDAGQQWNSKGLVANYPYNRTFYCGLKDTEMVVSGDVNCHVSYDGGLAFTDVNNWGDYYADNHLLHADIQSVQAYFDSVGDEYFYINTDGGTYISKDALASTTNISLNNLNVSQYYSVYTCKKDPNYIYAGAQDQGFQLCDMDTGDGLFFRQVVSGDYGHVVSSDSGLSIWMNYPGFADFYPDITNDQKHHGWTFTCKGQVWIPPMMVDPTDPYICWLGGGSNSGASGHLYKLTYNSSSKKVTAEEQTFNFGGSDDRISAMATAPYDFNLRMVLTDKGLLYVTKDGGTNWVKRKNFNGPGAHYLYGASVIFAGKYVAIGGSGYSNPGFWLSADTGKTWTPHTFGIPETMIYELAFMPDSQQIFAATDNGPYMFGVKDTTWYHIANGEAPDQSYWSVDYIPRTNVVRFGTYGRGIWDFKIGGYKQQGNIGMSALNTNSKLSVFPIPSNDQLTVAFNSVKNSIATVYVYDLNGKQLDVHQHAVAAGSNALNFSTAHLISGSYLLNIVDQQGQSMSTTFIVQR